MSKSLNFDRLTYLARHAREFEYQIPGNAGLGCVQTWCESSELAKVGDKVKDGGEVKDDDRITLQTVLAATKT